MCGIGGIVGLKWHRSQIESMANIQSHRGPDNQGLYIDPHHKVGLIHNRLKIIDLSETGNQPMSNPDNSKWIVFNGEIYNYLEIKSELSDYPYKSETDTEVILAAYEKWGDRCVEHFIGMFAFAIWDTKINTLFCARDRLGIKPFYYTKYDNCFIFSSEIKGILATGYPAEPDRQTWSEYLIDGYYDHNNKTFFEGIKSLDPGKTLKLSGDKISETRYWNLFLNKSETLHNISDKDATEQLSYLIKDSVKLRLRSDVPLGINLSGGIDSASLAATMSLLVANNSKINAFTASYNESKYDELKFADQTILDSQIVQHTSRLNPKEVPEMTNECMWYQEGPYGGISTLSYYKLHKLAKTKNVTVLLEGQGVDELFAGYKYFYPSYLADLMRDHKWKELNLEFNSQRKNLGSILSQMKIITQGGKTNTYQDGTNHLKIDCISSNIRKTHTESKSFDSPYNDHLTNALYRDLFHTKLPRVLRFNDRLSMAHSRELREPFLDHRLVEFAFNLPANKKIREGIQKFIIRENMKNLLPGSILNAEKRPVVTPQREWIKSSIKPFIMDIIHSQSFEQREFFDVKQVRKTFKEFCDGNSDNSFFIWQWVNTEIWFRTFIDNDLKQT